MRNASPKLGSASPSASPAVAALVVPALENNLEAESSGESPAGSWMHVPTWMIFACHAGVSVSMTLLNKQLMVVYPYLWHALLVQCALSVPLIFLADLVPRMIRRISVDHLRDASMISALFVLCIVTSFYGLRSVHVPMVVVGKNLTPFCTALLERLVLKAPLKPRTLPSLALCIIGSLLYTLGDASLTATGLAFVACNALIVAATCVAEKSVVQRIDQSSMGLSMYRNALAVPFLFMPLQLGAEPAQDAWDSLVSGGAEVWIPLSLATAFGALMGLLLFELQSRVAATSIQVANLCYKVLTTLLSLLLFPDSIRDMGVLAVIGYSLSMVGIALYALPAVKALLYKPKQDSPMRKMSDI